MTKPETEESINPNFALKFNSFVGKIGLGVSLLLMPPVFSNFLAVGELLDKEKSWLWIFFVITLCISLFSIFRKKFIGLNKSFLYFTVLLLICTEIIFRSYVHFFFSSEKRKNLADQCNYTYPEFTAYIAHPFLQFIGRPSTLLKGNNALSGTRTFNNMGFGGADFKYEKSENFIRIACIGESTTADGWPWVMQNYLNEHRSSNKYRYEVMNFAHGYWTSAHGVINVLLNITDFNPDFIVVHHGWNENVVRDAEPESFRGDYFHDLKAMSEPVIYDKYPIRLSLIYRVLKFKYNPMPEWMTMNGRVEKDRAHIKPLYQKPEELKPYRRNIENIINIALLHNIKVIMTTIPRSTNPDISLAYTAPSLDQCNVINRELANKYTTQLFFVDLDSLITGKHNEIFTDLAHVNDEGRNLKAQIIGDVILKNTIEQAEKISHVSDAAIRKNDIEFYSGQIKNYPTWLNSTKEQALKRNKTIEEMININAEWMSIQDSIKFSKNH